VYVEGTPDVRSYTTTDGRNGASLTLRISSVQLLGAKPAGSNTGGGSDASNGGDTGSGGYQNAGGSSDTTAMDDLPF
jgi:single-strand DNA-binding protein